MQNHTYRKHHFVGPSSMKDEVQSCTVWADGGADFIFADGTILSFCDYMNTFVAFSPYAVKQPLRPRAPVDTVAYPPAPAPSARCTTTDAPVTAESPQPKAPPPDAGDAADLPGARQVSSSHSADASGGRSNSRGVSTRTAGTDGNESVPRRTVDFTPAASTSSPRRRDGYGDDDKEETLGRDLQFTAWTLGKYREKVIRALHVYNTFTVRPRLFASLLPPLEEEEEALYEARRRQTRRDGEQGSDPCQGLAPADACGPAATTGRRSRVRVWMQQAPMDTLILARRKELFSRQTVYARGRAAFRTVQNGHEDPNKDVTVAVGSQLVLWCALRQVCLTVHYNRATFSVRWPAPVEGAEDGFCSSATASATVGGDLGHTVQSLLSRHRKQPHYTYVEQVFLVEFPPPVWAPMLQLALEMDASVPLTQTQSSDAEEAPREEGAEEEDTLLYLPLPKPMTLAESNRGGLSLDDSTTRTNTYNSAPPGCRFSKLEAAHVHPLLVAGPRLLGTDSNEAIHGRTTPVLWRCDWDRTERMPTAVYFALDAMSSSRPTATAAVAEAIGGDSKDNARDLSPSPAETGAVLALVYEDASVMGLYPLREGYKVVHRRADQTVKSYHVNELEGERHEGRATTPHHYYKEGTDYNYYLPTSRDGIVPAGNGLALPPVLGPLLFRHTLTHVSRGAPSSESDAAHLSRTSSDLNTISLFLPKEPFFFVEQTAALEASSLSCPATSGALLPAATPFAAFAPSSPFLSFPLTAAAYMTGQSLPSLSFGVADASTAGSGRYLPFVGLNAVHVSQWNLTARRARQQAALLPPASSAGVGSRGVASQAEGENLYHFVSKVCGGVAAYARLQAPSYASRGDGADTLLRQRVPHPLMTANEAIVAAATDSSAFPTFSLPSESAAPYPSEKRAEAMGSTGPWSCGREVEDAVAAHFQARASAGSILFYTTYVEEVGTFTALTNGTVRVHFDDRTILQLIPNLSERGPTEGLRRATNSLFSEDDLVVSCLFRDATTVTMRAALCTPTHAAFRYLSFALPFRRYVLHHAAQQIACGDLPHGGEGNRVGAVSTIWSDSAAAEGPIKDHTFSCESPSFLSKLAVNHPPLKQQQQAKQSVSSRAARTSLENAVANEERHSLDASTNHSLSKRSTELPSSHVLQLRNWEETLIERRRDEEKFAEAAHDRVVALISASEELTRVGRSLLYETS